LLHDAIVEARRGKQTSADLFNLNSIWKITEAFARKFKAAFDQKFSYQALDFTAYTSIFEKDTGEFKPELPQGLVGERVSKDINRPMDNYLYDKYLYDSELEHEVLKTPLPARVVVYGKLPRKSIQLPTYTGGTTSPDFVYAIRGEHSDEISLHFIVETKSDDPRMSDKNAVDAQRKAFAAIGGNIEWDVKTDVADFEQHLRKLAE
jgi:type III restriction enzyme